MVFSTVESSITKSGQALGIFKKDWHDVIYDIQNTSGIANKFKASFSTTISSTDLDAIKKYNTEIKNGVTSKTAFNRCMLNTSSAAQNLVASANGATVSEEALTAATQKLTLAQRAGIAISKAFGTALNVALNVGITLAISAIITGITKLVNAEQEAKEKIEEQAKSAKQLSDDLFDLRKQYITLSKEVETDKSKKEQLTSVTEELLKKLGYEKSAVEGLVEEYGNLDNAINGVSLSALEEAENALKVEYGNKRNNLAKDKNLLDEIFNSGRGELYSFNVQSGNINSDITKALLDSNIFNKATTFGIDSGRIYLNGSMYSVDEMKQNYKDISDALTLLNSKFKTDILSESNIYKTLQAKQDELKKLIDEYDTSVNNLNNNLAQQQVLKGLQGKELPKTKEEFDTFADSVISASIASEQFIGSEEEIKNSIIAVLQSMPEFNDFFVQEQTDVQNTTDSVYKLKQATEELQTVLDDTFSNQSTIQSAFDKIQKGSSLSADEMLKLISICPELYKTFKKTSDGYTVSADDLISANEAITKSTKEEVQNQIEEYRKQAEEYKKQYESALNSGNYSEARNAFSQMEEANKEIGILELKLSAFGLTSERTVKAIEDIGKATDKLISKTKTLSSAIQEQDEKGQLSADTIMDIVEAGYAEALVYDELTGKVTLNKEAYIEAAKAQYDEQIALLETQIALIETVNSFSELNTGIKNSIGNIFNAAIAFTEFAKSVSTSEEKVSELEGRITALKVARDGVGKYTGSGSNEDTNKKAFDAANDLRKHWIAMGKDNTGKKYTEEMYYAWLDSADGYRYYFSDLEKYQDENRQYEEEIYKWRLEQDNKLFEQKLENNEKLIKEIKNGEYDDPIQKYDDLAKATENSLELIQARIDELIASGSGAVQDEIDSLKQQAEELQEDLAEIEKDKLKTRVENEKTFWEQQKEAVETHYDNEIKNLEKIEDEQERINKKEELRLNLIKAQKELLDAKKNRNQLLFADGGFYYDYDQEAVQNAQENVTKAQQDITDFNNDETKRLLEEQRDNEIAYYNTIIEMLETYINKTLPIESSDSEIFNTAMNSKYAQAVLEKKNNIVKPETPVTLENILQNMGFKYNKEVVSAGYDLLGNVMSNPLKMPFDILGAYSKMNAQNYTVNNNNNNSVYIENMPITVPVGTTEEQVQAMIDQFASGVISTVRAKRAKLQ